MFPAVVHARRRNIRTPERRVSQMQRRSPSDGIMPHSLSPEKGVTLTEPFSSAATVGSSWMLRYDTRAEVHAEIPPRIPEDSRAATTNLLGNLLGSPGQLRHRQEHYGFNPTAHTNDRAVALACVAAKAVCEPKFDLREVTRVSSGTALNHIHT